MSERYDCLRSTVRKQVVLIHREADQGFYAVPDHVRRTGPWRSIHRGDVTELKLTYRLALARDGYVLIKDAGLGWRPDV